MNSLVLSLHLRLNLFQEDVANRLDRRKGSIKVEMPLLYDENYEWEYDEDYLVMIAVSISVEMIVLTVNAA